MTTKERINQYLNSKGISPTKAEVMLNWGKGSLTKSSSMSTDKLEELLLLFNDLSAEWLLRGEGEMYKKTSTPNSVKHNEAVRINSDFLMLKEYKMEGTERDILFNLKQIISIEDRITTSIIKKSDGQEIEVKCAFAEIVNCLKGISL